MTPLYNRSVRWEYFKISMSEFFWRFHPRRNRWCKHCGEFTGNSRQESSHHVCGCPDEGCPHYGTPHSHQTENAKGRMMMANCYILDGKTPVAATIKEWSRWFKANLDKRHVAQDTIGRYWVSTVFLGLNQSWGDGPPLLFETMVFDQGQTKIIEWPEGTKTGHNPVIDDYTRRWHTWDEAEAGHALVMRQLKAKTMNIRRIK